MRFFCIDDFVPEASVRFLRQACKLRRIEFVHIDTRGFDFRSGPRPARGDLLYRPAITFPSIRLEQTLLRDGVATFYARPEAAFFHLVGAPIYYERHGLPIPATVFAVSTEPAALRSHVEMLGGFPLVAKALGFSSGIGVIRVDSMPALVSVLDYMIAQGSAPMLSRYVDAAVHWRAIVLGDSVLSCYRNRTADGDFRTFAAEDRADYEIEPRPDLAALAVRAVALGGTELGGVDVLEDSGGRLYLLEVNFPCYYATPTEVAGIDIAGPMVDFLAAKARKLLEEDETHAEQRRSGTRAGGTVEAPGGGVEQGARPGAAEQAHGGGVEQGARSGGAEQAHGGGVEEDARPGGAEQAHGGGGREEAQAVGDEVGGAPRIVVRDGFATGAEIEHVLALAADGAALAARGVKSRRDETGLSFELPVAGDAVLERLAARMEAAVGLENEFGGYLRFRRYEPGESHPPHLDAYEIDDLSLVATALLYLTDTETGGETRFSEARPAPVSIAPRSGRLAIWWNYDSAGRPDPASLHEALPVIRGTKATVADFIYRRARAPAAAALGVP